VVDEIENNLNYLIQDQNQKQLSLGVHPYIEAFLKKGFKKFQIKWFFKYKQWVKIREMRDFHFLEYQFYNKNNDIIKQ
jgi:ribonuclease G